MNGLHLHPYRPLIPPVAKGISRPLWSVMIPTYNCANYLRETLASVLAQDPGPESMQIEVVDDHSTKDDPQAVVKELGQGRVSFYQQPRNVGHVKNFNTCLERSRGQIIHLLHGDDCIRDGFYRQLQSGFQDNSNVGAAFCRYIYMDEWGNWQVLPPLEKNESGILNNWLEQILTRQRIQVSAIVVKRNVYEKLGGFDQRMSCWGEDWEMWVRIAANYQVWYETEPLALYRKSSTSLSGKSIRSGKNIQDFRQAIDIVQEYLPEYYVKQVIPKTLKNYAFHAATSANKFLLQDDIYGAKNQIREALKCSASFDVLRHILKIITIFSYRKFCKVFDKYINFNQSKGDKI